MAEKRTTPKKKKPTPCGETPSKKRSSGEAAVRARELEQLVAERTAELERRNRQLEKDILLRKEAEEALRRSEERYRILSELTMDSASSIMLLPDGRFHREWVADKLFREYGYDPSEVDTLEKWIGMLHPDDREMAKKGFAEVLSGRTVSREGRIIDKKGQQHWIVNTIYPRFDGHSRRVIGFISAVREITERKQMLDSIQRIQNLDRLAVLSGGIAHDFNNLLSAMFGYVDMARTVATDDRMRQLLEKALQSFDRARDLTQQLLTFAKGGIPHKRIAPLGPVVQHAAEFSLAGSTVRCCCDFPGDLWLCDFDQNHIGQVVSNLVLNAKEAMPRGGVIEMAAENHVVVAEDDPSLRKGKYIKLTVRDRGTGIAKDVLPRIFDPFFTTKPKGSGLGLAISHSIIRKHGGRIDAESEPGVGTVFTVYLPASDGETSAVIAEREPLLKRSGRVLVMDDDAAIRDLAVEMLSSLGFTAVAVPNGSEAIERYAEEMRSGTPFDAVLLDLTMPGDVGGVDTLEALRAIDPAVVAAASSGYSEDPVMASPAQYGFRESLRKPYRLRDMAELMSRLFV
ncbi:MAG TPA: ATP-binding protein [bacterium]|nr:ATP-binding protein [bacterium]